MGALWVESKAVSTDAWLVVGWVVDSDDSKAVLKAATMAELMAALTVG